MIWTVLTTLTTMGVIEAIVKPAAIALTQTFAPRGTAEALRLADRLIPQLLDDDKTGADLERRLREGMIELTGDEGWGRRDLTAVWRRFDPRILLDRNP